MQSQALVAYIFNWRRIIHGQRRARPLQRVGSRLLAVRLSPVNGAVYTAHGRGIITAWPEKGGVTGLWDV